MKLGSILMTIAGLFMVRGATARGDDVRYGFQQGERFTYEIKIAMKIGDNQHMQSSYLMMHTMSVDGEGQARLEYAWNTESTPSSLEWMFGVDPTANGREISVDAHGVIVDVGNAKDDAQLDGSQGPAWRLVMLPLPTGGQNSWATERKIDLVDARGPLGFPFGGIPPMGPFGGPMPGVNRTDTQADENVNYAAEAVADGQMKIHRQIDLATKPDADPSVREHIHGDGEYVFDTRQGRVTSLQWNLNADVEGQNGPITIPVTVSARLISGEELAQLKSAADADEAAQKAAEAKRLADIQADGGLPDDDIVRGYKSLPDGMMRTVIQGTDDGGDFAFASRDGKPVMGFKFRLGESFGHYDFSDFEPLYSTPTGKLDHFARYVYGRPGYAVGAMTINAGTRLNAFNVTFMKMTATGLDPTVAYTTNWYGRRIGTSFVRLDGKGKFIYGICGRRRLAVVALGLIMQAPAGYDSQAGEAVAEAEEAKAKAAADQMKAQQDAADQAAAAGEAAKADLALEAQGRLPADKQVTDPNNIPADMIETQIMGTTQGGGPFVIASAEHKPLLGFLVRLGQWDNRVCFSDLAPIYSRPTAGLPRGELLLLAKDGYAVGSVTVNTGEFLNALCVRFMKINGSGLDENTSYVSPWYGKKIGTAQTKLDGKGNFIYGIFGRRGLNVDAMGLVIAAPAADDGNKS